MQASIASFEQLALREPVLQALNEVGYESPSPIQAACIPHLLAGHDLLGQAQTGTGKTAAFALPALECLDLTSSHTQVLVLTPTRELAVQVAEAFQRYASRLKGFHVQPIYGGQSMVVQLKQLKRGAHVVVGTPGRVMDHIRRGSLDLTSLRTLVLDEADEMLRMGFIDDVQWILDKTPAQRQTALFSATMPEAIRRVAARHLNEPQHVRIQTSTSTVASTHQQYCEVAAPHKLEALTRILETAETLDAGIIFVRTKSATVELAQKLEARGYACAALNGDMTQQLRERAVEQLKSGALDIIIATDVAARGLDVPRISHVINYDVPYDTESYVHRIGRTGRAGRTGSAILFVTPREKRMLKLIERATAQKIEPLKLPSREAVTDRRVAMFREQIGKVLKSEELGFFRKLVGDMEAAGEATMEDIAAAMALLAQRERPLQAKTQGPDISQREPSSAKPRRDNQDRILTRRRAASDGRLSRYRVEVGQDHGVSARDIVGALANEAGIETGLIGQINLYEHYAIVELPTRLPPNIRASMARLRVRQHRLTPSRVDAGEQKAAHGRPRPPVRRSGTGHHAGAGRKSQEKR